MKGQQNQSEVLLVYLCRVGVPVSCWCVCVMLVCLCHVGVSVSCWCVCVVLVSVSRWCSCVVLVCQCHVGVSVSCWSICRVGVSVSCWRICVMLVYLCHVGVVPLQGPCRKGRPGAEEADCLHPQRPGDSLHALRRVWQSKSCTLQSFVRSGLII